ncbi:MAG: hypothetical protein DMG78_11795 [Acidobacteria bacterium]|nr:MAG: hypothetical protein DMG78_11795 [Acidobacteriota bacterium]
MAVTLGQNTKDSVQFASENSWFPHGWAVMPATALVRKITSGKRSRAVLSATRHTPVTRHTGIYLMDAVFHGDC